MYKKYEDMLLRVVSKHYPYVKKIDFFVGGYGEDPIPYVPIRVDEVETENKECDDLIVTVHIDVNMVNHQGIYMVKPDLVFNHQGFYMVEDGAQDYLHNLFMYTRHTELSKDSFDLDELIYNMSSPFTKLLIPNIKGRFDPGSFLQYVIYNNLT
jgi:hypothetical protein